MVLKSSFRGYSRKKSLVGAAFAAFAAFVEESSNEESRRKSGGKSSAGSAFGIKGSHNSSGSGTFGNLGFLKRLLGKAGIVDIAGLRNGGLTELLLQAQLGDADAIQLLIDNGMDAKDTLGIASLAGLALGGDMDAHRLLASRGISLTGPKRAADEGGYTPVIYTSTPVYQPLSALQQALSAAGDKIRSIRDAAPKQAQSVTFVPASPATKMPV